MRCLPNSQTANACQLWPRSRAIHFNLNLLQYLLLESSALMYNRTGICEREELATRKNTRENAAPRSPKLCRPNRTGNRAIFSVCLFATGAAAASLEQKKKCCLLFSWLPSKTCFNRIIFFAHRKRVADIAVCFGIRSLRAHWHIAFLNKLLQFNRS